MDTDFDILTRIKKSDENAFDLLFSKYYQQLCNYAGSLIEDSYVAEDIVQELFANLWIQHHKLKINTSVKSYLYKATHNACLDFLKHSKMKDRFIKNTLLQKELPEFDDKLERAELLSKINETIEKLPSQCQKIFLLSRFENLKYREIAEHLAISENTVDTQMRRALTKLRQELAEYLLTAWMLINLFF